MKNVNIKKEVSGSLEDVISKTTAALSAQGFGVLTRIDFHAKMKEKLGLDMPATVILGACNPKLAFEAYSTNPDVTAMLPCNAVVRDISGGKMSVELVLPSAMMRALGSTILENLAADADKKIHSALEAV